VFEERFLSMIKRGRLLKTLLLPDDVIMQSIMLGAAASTIPPPPPLSSLAPSKASTGEQVLLGAEHFS
jgi:hypothetical protein